MGDPDADAKTLFKFNEKRKNTAPVCRNSHFCKRKNRADPPAETQLNVLERLYKQAFAQRVIQDAVENPRVGDPGAVSDGKGVTRINEEKTQVSSESEKEKTPERQPAEEKSEVGEDDSIDNGQKANYNLYTTTDDFINQVPYGLRNAFARSLANKTSGMAEGEIRTVYVSGYIFEADKYMHGRILAPYNSKTKKLLEERRVGYERIDEDRKIATVWVETVQDAERGSGGDIGVSRRGRGSITDDSLLGESSERHSSGDNERVRQTLETKAERDEIVKNLRKMMGLEKADVAA